ncbi:retrovirus-related pol polyprotein from transposon TNT 1-94 [Tanacetum coccineum]
MSTSKTYQQSLADAGSETRPPMLERGSYIPWASRFRRYINRKRENRKWLNKALDEGPYQFEMFIPNNSTVPKLQTAEDLQGVVIAFNDACTSKMMNRLRTSSNTRNQAIIQGDRVNIQSRNSGNTGRNNRRAYVQEEVVEGSNAPNETGNVQRTLRTSSSGNISTVQCYNCSGKGHYARNYPKPRVRDSKYFMEQMLLAKQDEARVILTDEQNDFLFADASRMEEIEELSANICLMARIQPADNTSDAGPSYDSAFIIPLVMIKLIAILYLIHPIGMLISGSVENDTHVPDLYLEAKLKKNVDLILKLGNSLQGMFMFGPKPLSMYDQQLKHGLGYPNPYTLKQAISQCPKLYLASSLGNSEISLNIRDTEDTLDDASKSQQKMYKKMNDPIVVANKQNCWTIDYAQINALYKDFVPQKELSAEQKYFPSSFIPSDKNSNATPSIPASMPNIKEMKDVFESTESELCELEKQNDFLKDQLLEVSLKHEVELSVLLNHECVDNSLHAEIEQLKKKSIVRS